MSLDLEARLDGTRSAVQAEVKATSGAASSTTPELATRGREATLLYSRPLLANPDPAPNADARDADSATYYRYAAPSNLSDWRQMAAVLLGDLAGKELLDYGCGTGEVAVYFARLGARVTAIDVSAVGISRLKKRAAHHKLAIQALEMPCDPKCLPASSFDRIHGMGILNRVGLDNGLAEVCRLLRPGGMGVFLEPMGDDPSIDVAKRLLMGRERLLAEPDDLIGPRYPTWKEIEASTRRFWRAAAYPYHLLYRLRRYIPRSMHDAVRRFDHGLLSMVPGLRPYAGAVVLQVVK